VAVSLDEKTLLQSLDKERRRNTVFTLTVSGDGKNEQVTAMIRDAQIDPMSRRLVHVDVLRVDLDKEVHVTVPLVLTGKAVGTVGSTSLGR
jgi:large subunit ribosomal protein L25